MLRPPPRPRPTPAVSPGGPAAHALIHNHPSSAFARGLKICMNGVFTPCPSWIFVASSSKCRCVNASSRRHTLHSSWHIQTIPRCTGDTGLDHEPGCTLETQGCRRAGAPSTFPGTLTRRTCRPTWAALARPWASWRAASSLVGPPCCSHTPDQRTLTVSPPGSEQISLYPQNIASLHVPLMQVSRGYCKCMTYLSLCTCSTGMGLA